MFERLLGKRSRPPVPIVLYTRPGCGLCDEMKQALRATQLSAAYDLREIDIETDPDLLQEHGQTIPVLEIAGRRAFEGRLAPDELRRAFDHLAAEWFRERGEPAG